MTCDLSILTAVSLGPNMAELGVLGPSGVRPCQLVMKNKRQGAGFLTHLSCDCAMPGSCPAPGRSGIVSGVKI